MVVVFFQIGVVSEVPVLGVNADLTPLLVVFVGLLGGSTLGAATGFSVGLLVDLALLQTLGLTSLVFTLIGYWAGRLRELRDPQAALTPLLVGAGASAAALIGYSLMEFLLGVDAPVSLELLRQIILGTLVNTIVALPMFAARAARPGQCPARGSPAPAPPPRLHDRRSEPADQSMSSIEPVRRRTPTLPVPQGLAVRVAILGMLAIAMFSVIFFRLWYLQVLSGEQYVQQANTNRVRDLPIAAPRGRDPRPLGAADRHQQNDQCGSDRPLGTARSRGDRKAVDDLPGTPDRGRSRPPGHRRGPAQLSGDARGEPCGAGERAELLRLKSAAENPPAVPVPALPADATRARRLFSRLSRLLGMAAREIDEQVVRGMSAVVYAPVTIKTDAGPGVLTEIGERANEYPGVIQQPVSLRDYPYGRNGRERARLRRLRLQARAQEEGLPRRHSGDDRRSGRARVLLRPLPARQSRHPARGGQRGRLSRALEAGADAARSGPEPSRHARHGPAA